MNTILLPTDFSSTSKNAAAYAIQLAKSFGVKKIVLYHAFEIPVTGDPIVPVLQMIDYESIKKANEENLQQFAEEIKVSVAESGIAVESFCELSELSDGVAEACTKYGADLVIAGISEANKIEETLIGSSAISIAKQTTVPVIIVPDGAVYTPYKNVLFACDFKKIIETTPIDAIKQIVNNNRAKLLVLHVNHTAENYSTEMEHEIKMLNGLLEGMYPEYHFVDNEDFMQGINDFATAKNVDLIITIPKKHGFFEKIFKKSHLKMLAYHSHIPLMVVHD
jgi:nucleotide-binding universal stress UspA family protein